jgi:predicted nuclease of predicted toxin-antitoxin system
MGKAAFVDGASLWHLTLNLGHDRINAFGLYDFLASLEAPGHSQSGFCQPPIVTFYRGHSGVNPLAGRMTLAGFDVRRTELGADDALLIEEIQKTDVEHIILVTQDSDFLPIAMRKAISGIHVTWVGSENAVHPDNASFTLSRHVLNAMGENPRFIEINSHGYQVFHEKVQRIRRIKWWKRTKRSA